MKWQMRLIRNSLVGLVPFPDKIRKIKRKIKPPPTNPAQDEWTLEQGLRQVEMLQSVDFTIAGKTVLELGTGWQPIIPLIFSLAGAKKVILLDNKRLMDRHFILKAIENVSKFAADISKRLKIPRDEIENRSTHFDQFSLDEIVNYFRLEYIAPSDARKTKLGDKSIDIIISRAVLEHIPPEIIQEISIEFRRILKDDGRICHFIDNSDHWEHRDKSISRINFLKFSDFIWKFTSINPIDYQNRLRHFEYISLLNQTGFKIDYSGAEPDEKALNDLKQIKICKRYQHVTHEELAILTSYIVASKK